MARLHGNICFSEISAAYSPCMCKQFNLHMKKQQGLNQRDGCPSRRTASLMRIQTPPSSELSMLYPTDTMNAKS